MSRVEHIGDATLYLGDCREILPTLDRVDHVICDPPYEASLHASKNSLRGRVRVDSGPDLRGLDFAPIDDIRAAIIDCCATACNGWFIAFCTVEGVAKWVDAIKPSPMKYKRACIWVKPDSTPQLNGQGPAQGAECFVVAWCGKGHAKWHAGGKRGVYTHNTNGPTREGTHPTEKPVSLMKELLRDFSHVSDMIVDPFMGSGTTGVACAHRGQPFIGIELNEAYFDLSCRRIEQAHRQPDFFHERPKPAKQEAML